MKNLVLIFTLLLAGCSVKQQITKTDIPKDNVLKIKVNNQNDKFLFEIINTSTDKLIIYQPTKLVIEKFINGTWQALRILPCPCDAPCMAPKEKQELVSGESFSLSWNKEESWCGTERVNNVRNTVKQKVSDGTYRIKLSILNNERGIVDIYKEFSIN